MADSSVAVTAGSGTDIDTRTEGTNGNHRQVIVVGDPSTNAGVAPVDGTAGLKVNLGADNDITVTGDALTALQLIDNIVLAEDAAHSSGESGILGLAVRSDAGGSLVDTDGDRSPLSLDSAGALRVTGGGGGTEYTEDVAAPADPVGTALQLVRLDTPATITGADNDWVTQRATNYGAAYVQLVTSAGAFIDSVGGGTEYTEDVVSANPIVGKAILMERDDELATVTPAEGDWIGLRGTAEGALWTRMQKGGSVVDSGNSTTATLGISANYTGTGVDLLGYAAVTVTIYANVASATDGMTFQFSTDNSNWDDTYTFTEAAGETRRFQFPVTARYFRVNYTNGGTGQAAFRVQTMLHPLTPAYTSIHRAGDNVDPDRSAELVKSVLVAQLAGSGDFTPIDATTGGNLKVSVEEVSGGLDIGAGNAGSETIRVSIASDDVNLAAQTTAAAAIQAAVETIDNAIAGSEMQVDVVGSLPAGTNAIGKLAANSGVDIGDVDVTSVADQYDEYETVAASQTAQALGATGAAGDYISGILVVPATTSPGNVLLLDNATSITVFTGGASSVSNLVPFLIPLGMSSVSGAWKITTGANVSCIGIGRFT